MKQLVLVIYLLVPVWLTLAGCQTAATAPTPTPPPTPTLVAGQYTHDDLVQLFEYDPETPLGIQEVSVTDEEDGASVHDISYMGTPDYRVPAFLVVPPGEGPFAGVLFMHQGFGSRESFLGEAIDLAKKGVVSLLVHHGTWTPEPSHYQRIVISLRRGADLLAQRQDVDSGRLGYVGHSWGATFGGILTDIDRRFQTYVLMAGVPAFSAVWDRDDLAPFDGEHYILHAAPSPLLFQLATDDEWVSRETALAYYEAASEPKEIRWYETDHSFENVEAQRDRMEWLQAGLNLP